MPAECRRAENSDNRHSRRPNLAKVMDCGGNPANAGATPLWLCGRGKSTLRQLAQRGQSVLLAREGGFADAVHRFGVAFVATSVVTLIAIAAPPTQRVGLGISDKVGEPGSRLRSWPSKRNIRLTMNLSPCSAAGGPSYTRPQLQCDLQCRTRGARPSRPC